MASLNFRRGVTLFQLKRQLGRNFSTSQKTLGGGYDNHGGDLVYSPQHKVEIGKREIVGYGNTGEATYIDHPVHPFPAIRFKEDTPEISKLREKEKGDWKKMTVEEKKMLYRASFCQTFEEMNAPQAWWPGIIGGTLFMIGFGMMVAFGSKYRKF